MSRRARTAAVVLLAALPALLAGCSAETGAAAGGDGEFRFVQATPEGRVIPPAERAAAPDFSGTLIGGGDWNSSALDGGPAVINFWGSWCAPCRVETPEFQEVAEETQDEGVQFLGVAVKEADPQFPQAFVDRFGVTYPSLYDPRGEVVLAFRGYPANAVPSTIVLDAQGRVAAVYTGAVRQDDLRAVLAELVEEV